MRTLRRVGPALLAGWLFVPCLLACGDDAEDGAADSGEPAVDAALDSGSDAASDTDAASAMDTGAPELTCDDIVMFGSFDTTCSTDDDCVLLGSCGGALWVAVSEQDEDEARALHEAIAFCGGSDGPIMAARCEAQRCIVAPSGQVCGNFMPDDDAGQL